MAEAEASTRVKAAMTEPVRPEAGHGTGTTARRARPAMSAARRRRVPSLKVTAVAAIAGFLVVFELLAYQLRSGHDPAIGSGSLTAQVRSSSPAGGPQAAPTSSGGVVTRASGVSAAPAPAAPAAAAGARPPQRHSHAIATRSSGGGGSGLHSTSGEDGYEHEGGA